MRQYTTKRTITKIVEGKTEVEIYEMVLAGVICRFPNGFWRYDDGKHSAAKCIKYLLEDKLKWSIEDIKSKININTFNMNGLSGALAVFGGTPWEALEYIYPGKIKPWELQASRSPNNYWSRETAIVATKWLIEDTLELDIEDICNANINHSIVQSKGLWGMLLTIYDGSIYHAITTAYPNHEFRKCRSLFCCNQK